jgi:short-subunit dehydrogenase
MARPDGDGGGGMIESWDGTKVLLTGASSGIGASLARELAAHGAVVGMCARRAALMEDVLADCRKHIEGCRAWSVDLADLDTIEPFVARATAELGGIDVLINNAGYAIDGPALDLDWADVEYLTRLNYLSPVRVTRAVLPAMLERGRGAVQTMSSMAARMATPGEAAYAAPKAALGAYFEALAAEHWTSGVSFHLVYPALIDLGGNDGDDDLATTTYGNVRIPTQVMARAMRHQIEAGHFELYMPNTMAQQVAARAKDVAKSVAFFADLYASGGLLH